MPRQSRPSLNDARTFKTRATTNRMGRIESMEGIGGSAASGRRQLEHLLAGLDQPQLLAGDLLEVVGVGPEAVHVGRQPSGFNAERAHLALERLHLLLERPDAREALPAVGGEGQREHRQHRRAEKTQPARAHRPWPPKAARPGQTAAGPSSSSMRRSWLYFAVRSPREREPVLICPALTATARSATKVSSVSPERCEMTVPQPARFASSTASSVSVSVPIWFTLTRTALARPWRMPSWRMAGLVTKRSSPTSWTREPSRCVRARQPSWSSSPSPSSIEQMG